jgi:hypothetical protein
MKTLRMICLLCMVIAPDVIYATSQTQKKLMRKEIGPTSNLPADPNHMEAFIEAIDKDTVCADDPTRRRTSHMSCSQFVRGHGTNWCALAPSSRRRSYGGQAKDTCKQTCNLCGEVNLKFGGASHGAAKQANWFYRPEAIKSLVCGATTCSDCTDKDTCWHGVTSPVGWMKLNVPSSMYNIPHTRFVVELWAKCSNGKGSWKVYARHLVNGDVKVFANAKLVGSVSQSQSFSSSTFRVLLPVDKDTHIRAEFARISASAASSGQLWLMATDVDQYVEDCMAVKDCLSNLGDGSKEAYKLRNDNKKQLKCLSATTDAARDAINLKCKPWVKCLAKDAGRISKLKSLLAAGQEGSSMLIAISDRDAMASTSGWGTRRRKPVQDQSECIDPATDDPESWSCDCVQDLIDECGGIHASCFRTQMCQSTEICTSWKKSHCPGWSSLISKSNESTTEEKKATSLVLMRRTTSHAQGAIDNGLDGSLKGKCAA